MMIGNASVILVVTISQTSQDYILSRSAAWIQHDLRFTSETGSHEKPNPLPISSSGRRESGPQRACRRIVAVTAGHE
jgi:hypothetical protein